MLKHIGETEEQFESYVKEIRHYRDKFLAHLDDDLVMQIPMLDSAKLAVEFYHTNAIGSAITDDDLAGLPMDLANYYDGCLREATLALAQLKL